MSRINVDAAALTAMAASHVVGFALVELGFNSGTVYLADLPHDVTVDGHLYVAAQGLGTIEPITETGGSVSGLVFTLSGVTDGAIAGALTEMAQAQGCPVTIKWVVVDGTALRLDPNVWSGYFDTPALEDGVPTATIRISAESALIRWRTARGTLSSDADQRVRLVSDKFFEYAAQVANKTLVWPDASFFRQK